MGREEQLSFPSRLQSVTNKPKAGPGGQTLLQASTKTPKKESGAQKDLVQKHHEINTKLTVLSSPPSFISHYCLHDDVRVHHGVTL
ncbi:hypothetical protein EYF80_009324 [Liparis tanakae]|uniref:Uncharacterized protein n=1 Tax=Liparis tanakae TaxID=230148 RepID=A0A4Z2IQM9_9TELE|nr:hypothetical protein EYF80_009324 [Liparis tanakae]